MIIQILLSLGLGFILLFYLSNSRRASPTNLFAVLGAGSGLVFVWKPQLATEIAGMLGVGRGADLLFYCWVMISIALFLSVHFKFRQLNEQITDLVREIAIADAHARMLERRRQS